MPETVNYEDLKIEADRIYEAFGRAFKRSNALSSIVRIKLFSGSYRTATDRGLFKCGRKNRPRRLACSGNEIYFQKE